jgi:hypothetical protein
MTSGESIRFAGDVNIDKIEIVSNNGLGQNITNQVIGIEIYEDLFSPFITGLIVVKDSLDLANLFPFTGEEFINLKIRTPTFDDKKTYIDAQYYVYRMANREMLGERNLGYELHFISPEAVVDLNKKVSKTFSGKISDIAQKLIIDSHDGLESKKNVFVENTPNNVKYISNFWSPVKNLNFISGNAVNSNNAADYLFYENRTGLNFNSLEYLYSQPVKQEFIYDAYMRDFGADGRSMRNINEDYKRIVEISVPEPFDYIDRSTSGMFGSKMITFDITTKKYVSKNYDMLDNFSKELHLNQYPITSTKNIRRANSLVFNYPKYYGNFTNFGDVTNSKIIQKRMSRLKQAGSTKLNVTVPGRTDYTVGMKVNVTLYKMNPLRKEETDIKDTLFSGNYIIAAVSHSISREKHECLMELTKDSYIMDLDKGGK